MEEMSGIYAKKAPNIWASGAVPLQHVVSQKILMTKRSFSLDLDFRVCKIPWYRVGMIPTK